MAAEPRRKHESADQETRRRNAWRVGGRVRDPILNDELEGVTAAARNAAAERFKRETLRDQHL